MIKVPPANRAAVCAVLLRDVFGYIVRGSVSLPVKRCCRSKTKSPTGQIIHRLPFTFFAAIHKAHGFLIAQSMKMYRPVFMQFRHRNVFEPPPPHMVVCPLAEFAHGCLVIISIYQLLVKGQREKEVKIIAGAQLENLLARAMQRAARRPRLVRSACPYP